LVCVVRADTSGYGRLFPDGSKSGLCSHSVYNVHERAGKAGPQLVEIREKLEDAPGEAYTQEKEKSGLLRPGLIRRRSL